MYARGGHLDHYINFRSPFLRRPRIKTLIGQTVLEGKMFFEMVDDNDNSDGRRSMGIL